MLYIIHENMEVETTFMINWVFSPSAGSESKEDKSISNGIPHRLTFPGRSLIRACVKGPFAPINFQQQGHCTSPEVRTYIVNKSTLHLSIKTKINIYVAIVISIYRSHGLYSKIYLEPTDYQIKKRF